MEIQGCTSMPAPTGGYYKRQAGICVRRPSKGWGNKRKRCVQGMGRAALPHPACGRWATTGSGAREGTRQGHACPAASTQELLSLQMGPKTGTGTQSSGQACTHPCSHPVKMKNKGGRGRAPRSPTPDRAAGTWAESSASGEARRRRRRRRVRRRMRRRSI